jgi:hypothetical protein
MAGGGRGRALEIRASSVSKDLASEILSQIARVASLSARMIAAEARRHGDFKKKEEVGIRGRVE